MTKGIVLNLLIAQLASFILTSISHASMLNLPYGVSPTSHDIYDLHMLALYVCCVIAIIVFALVIYSLIKFRKSKGAISSTTHENLFIEITWTVIPFLILVVLAIPATRILGKIHDVSESALTIKITGYQWKWSYEYLDHNVKFFSFLSTPLDQIYGRAPKNKWFLLEVDQPMVVPINKKVKLLITANDVIHSWWVPELGVKQDAIPGFINENWIYITTPGEYRGQCGELCGINHGFMPIVVKAVTQEDYDAWILQQQSVKTSPINLKSFTSEQLFALGKKEYERNCAMCHQNNGEGLAYSYPALNQSPVVVAPIDETILYVLRGVPSSSMQGFANILDDNSLAAIISYIRYAWRNGPLLQQANYPIIATTDDIQAMRLQLQSLPNN